MYAVLMAAFWQILGWLVSTVIIKFVVFTALFLVVAELMSVMAAWLPSALDLSALGGIPATVWYFLDLFNVTAGIPLLLSAFVTRFFIRRIPVIG
jgi:hypothetical protein